MITNLKNWVSRACETIDISIATKDAKLASTKTIVCSNLSEPRNLEPFDKAIITIGALGDEGASGLGGKAYIGSERIDKGAKETNWNLSPIKPKVTEKIIPAYAMMSKPLDIRNFFLRSEREASKQLFVFKCMKQLERFFDPLLLGRGKVPDISWA